MHTKTIILIGMALVNWGHSAAQGYSIKWYNTTNGLPQNSVKDIVKDTYGFLWLATEDGVCRYDGTSFLTYDKLEMNNKHMMNFHGTVASDSLYINSEYHDDVLLIHKRGVTKIAKNNYITKTRQKVFLELASPSYMYRGYDTAYNYLINTKYGQYLFSKDTVYLRATATTAAWQILPHATKQKLRTSFMLENELYNYDKAKKTCTRFEALRHHEIFIDPLFFHPKSQVYWQAKNQQAFLALAENVYLMRSEKNAITLQLVGHIPGFSLQNIVSMYFDSTFQKLFVGSITKGLGTVEKKHFQSVTYVDEALENVFYAQVPYDSVSVITPSGKIFSDKGYITQYPFGKIIDKDGMRLSPDRSLWVKNATQMSHFVRTKNNHYTKKETIHYKKRMSALFDLGKTVAAAFEKYDWAQYEKNLESELRIFDKHNYAKTQETYIFSKQIKALFELNDTTFLVGCREGLYTLNRRTKIKKAVLGSSALNIRNIQQTTSGSLWVMTAGQGLYLYRNNQLLPLPTDRNMAMKNPHCIVEDSTRALWISTNNGLFKIPEKILLAYVKHPQQPVYYYVYTQKDGMNTNEFNGGCSPCATKLANGQYTLPSMNGLVFFDPKDVPSYYPTTPIFVDRAVIDNSDPFTINDHLELDNNFYRATIFVDLPYYASATNNHIEAFLEGKSTSWERLDANNSYSITNLTHGTYTLKIRVLSSPSADFFYKTITVQVLPIFYQTLWFKILLSVLVIGLLIAIHILRLTYLNKLNKKLESVVEEKTTDLKQSLKKLKKLRDHLKQESQQQKKLIGTIGHDIATPLQYMSMVAKALYDLDPKDLSKNRKLIISLKNSSTELHTFTKALKEYAYLYNENIEKPLQNFDVYELVEEKKRLFEEIAKSKSIEITNHIHSSTFISANKSVLKAALHNIIDNAVKYTNSGCIELDYHKKGKQHIIVISDTGIGMDARTVAYYDQLQSTENEHKLVLQKFGLGLHLVVQLLPLIHGKIDFAARKPTGTIVTLKIKEVRAM